MALYRSIDSRHDGVMEFIDIMNINGLDINIGDVWKISTFSGKVIPFYYVFVILDDDANMYCVDLCGEKTLVSDINKDDWIEKCYSLPELT